LIPLGDSAPVERIPVVTWTLIAVCAVVYGYQFLLDQQDTHRRRVEVDGRQAIAYDETRDHVFIDRWGAIPSAVTHGHYERYYAKSSPYWDDLPGYSKIKTGVLRNGRLIYYAPASQDATLRDSLLSLLTSLFLHGSLMHLVGNMLFLYIFGDNVEDRLGHFGFLLFYLVGGMFASSVHILTEPSSSMPVIGASGAISAVLGAYILLFPRALVSVLIPFFLFWPIIQVPAILFLGFWFLAQLTNGFGALTGLSGGIAWWAHIGGFTFGVVMVFLNYNKWRTPPRRYSQALPVDTMGL
jgi:membrane associated rhomboid family serine protease